MIFLLTFIFNFLFSNLNLSPRKVNFGGNSHQQSINRFSLGKPFMPSRPFQFQFKPWQLSKLNIDRLNSPLKEKRMRNENPFRFDGNWDRFYFRKTRTMVLGRPCFNLLSFFLNTTIYWLYLMEIYSLHSDRGNSKMILFLVGCQRCKLMIDFVVADGSLSFNQHFVFILLYPINKKSLNGPIKLCLTIFAWWEFSLFSEMRERDRK
jgi:hypothetical protein